MSLEENKALVRRFHESGFQEIMRGNLDVAHEYFADHFHDHTSLHPEHTGVQGAKEAIADTGQAWPDMWFEVVDIAADGDIVFAHWRATGTHEGQHKVVKHVRDIEPQRPRVRTRARHGRGTRRQLLADRLVDLRPPGERARPAWTPGPLRANGLAVHLLPRPF